MPQHKAEGKPLVLLSLYKKGWIAQLGTTHPLYPDHPIIVSLRLPAGQTPYLSSDPPERATP